MKGAADQAATVAGVRLDKFLWACRFYKTRALATEAIVAGHVEVNGRHVKPAREMQRGDQIEMRLPQGTMTVWVRALAGRRGPASAAALLYEETAESRTLREREQALRRLEPAAERQDGRPTKRDRRHIVRFTSR